MKIKLRLFFAFPVIVSFCVTLFGTFVYAKLNETMWEEKAKSYVADVPKEVRDIFFKKINRQWNVIRRSSRYAKDQCVAFRFVKKPDVDGSIIKLPTSEINVMSDCLGDNGPLDEKRFKESFETELFIDWIRSKSRQFEGQIHSTFFENSFYYLSEDAGLNIEQNIARMTAQSVAIAYRRQDEVSFLERRPDLVYLVKSLFSTRFPNVFEIVKTYNGPTAKSILSLRARTKALYEGNDSWFARYQLVKKAQKSILVQSFSLFDDLYGRAFVGLLLEAMKERHVEVKLMLDGRGSLLTSRSDLVELLVRRGAQVQSYNPLLLSAFNISKYFQAGPIRGLLSSNHDKLMIVDDTKLITGGRNIGDRYFVRNGETEGMAYRDLDIYAEYNDRPIDAILGFNVEFYSSNTIDVSEMNLSVQKEEQVMLALRSVEAMMFHQPLQKEMTDAYPNLSKIESLTEYNLFSLNISEVEPVTVIGLDKTSALLDESVLVNAIFRYIDQAQKEILVVNPYIILTERMRSHLVKAGKRGVKIRILTSSPGSTDSILTQASLISEWKEMLQHIPNLEIYGAIGPEKLHAKAFVFDRAISIVGSYNLDVLSEKNNSEYAVGIQSAEFSDELADFLEDSMNNKALKYDVEKNIGPANIPGAAKKYKRMKRFVWIKKLLRPIL